MNAKKRQLITGLIIIGICLCFDNPLQATSSKLESNSPFLPPGYSTLKPSLPKMPQQPNSPLTRDLEFRGVVQLNGIYQFSLFKKSENRSYWIPENSAENGIGVSNFDLESMHITVTFEGRSEQLSLIAASENPLPVVATNSPSAQKPQEMPPGIQLPKNTKDSSPKRRTIPRRRVILPTKK